jgi:DNA modification methylase
MDILKTLPGKSVDCCVTSPPYYRLRDYGVSGQIGLEKTPAEYVQKLLAVFKEVYRVLKNEGSLWLNTGDSYNGSGKNSGNMRPLNGKQQTNTGSNTAKPLFISGMKPKQLIGVPWRLALAMQRDGWILRQDIIWAKPSCMPESVKDRFCRSHEYLFFFTKRKKYFFNYGAALEPAATLPGGNRNDLYKNAQDGTTGLRGRCRETPDGKLVRLKRDVWTLGQEQFHGEHYAAFPQKLVAPCVQCGCPENGIVLDPFMGSGTTAVVAKKLGRKYVGIEINPEYARMAERRIAETSPLFEGALG